jgi:hypothetical protein
VQVAFVRRDVASKNHSWCVFTLSAPRSLPPHSSLLLCFVRFFLFSSHLFFLGQSQRRRTKLVVSNSRHSAMAVENSDVVEAPVEAVESAGPAYDEATLTALTRFELQTMSKETGACKANLSNVKMIAALCEFYQTSSVEAPAIIEEQAPAVVAVWKLPPALAPHLSHGVYVCIYTYIICVHVCVQCLMHVCCACKGPFKLCVHVCACIL